MQNIFNINFKFIKIDWFSSLIFIVSLKVVRKCIRASVKSSTRFTKSI